MTTAIEGLITSSLELQNYNHIYSYIFQVKNFLVHFWQGMPAHITVILSQEIVIELIATCDNILYKVSTFIKTPV